MAVVEANCHRRRSLDSFAVTSNISNSVTISMTEVETGTPDLDSSVATVSVSSLKVSVSLLYSIPVTMTVLCLAY